MSQQSVQSKEVQILEAAEREFLAKGYDGARTTSIAQAAGVTHAMLHYYFRTKEQLFERIIDKKMSEIIPMLTCLLGNDSLPVAERIKEAVATHLDFIIANPTLPKFFMNEVLPHEHRCEMLRSKIKGLIQLFSDFQKEVDTAAENGEIEHFNVTLLFQTILSLNIFSGTMANFVEGIIGDKMLQFKSFLEIRRAENIETIMRRIKKQ